MIVAFEVYFYYDSKLFCFCYNCDLYYCQNGCVKEKGTHEDLMELKGLYFSLVERQTTGDEGGKGQKKQRDNKEAADKENKSDAAKNKAVEKEDETKLTQSRLKLYGRLLSLNKLVLSQ